jgi:hypothetical protein
MPPVWGPRPPGPGRGGRCRTRLLVEGREIGGGAARSTGSGREGPTAAFLGAGPEGFLVAVGAVVGLALWLRAGCRAGASWGRF